MTGCEFTHYCVEDFGAIGHATTPTFDSTAAIQAALDTAKVTGGRVTFGAAAYKITFGLTLTRSGGYPVTIEGRGRMIDLQVAGAAGTKLFWAGAAGGTMLSAVGVNGGGIRGLQLDCGTSNQADMGLYVASSVGAVYDSIDVSNATEYAYVLRGDKAGVYRNTFSNLSSQSTCNGGMLLDSTDIEADDCDVANNTFLRLDLVYGGANAGIDITSADANQFFGVTIVCHNDTTGGSLIHFRAGDSHQRGALLNAFYGLDGGTIIDGGTQRSLKHDSSFGNILHGISILNGIPSVVLGTNPQLCFLSYASGSIGAAEAALTGNVYFTGSHINVGVATYPGRSTTNPTNAINIYAGTAPAGTLANGVTIYAKDVTGTKKLFYMDSMGTEVGPLT